MTADAWVPLDEQDAVAAVMGLLDAFNQRDWALFDELVDRHLAPSWVVRFPANTYPDLPRSRYQRRARQATRMHRGISDTVVHGHQSESVAYIQMERRWHEGDDGAEVVNDVHLVVRFERSSHQAMGEPIRLLEAWEFVVFPPEVG